VLKQRILTALVLVPLAVAGVFLASPGWFAAVLGLILLGGAYEWGRLGGISRGAEASVFLLVCTAGFVPAAWWVLHGGDVLLPAGLMCLWWAWKGRGLLVLDQVQPASGRDLSALLVGVVVLATTLASMVWLHARPQGAQGVMLMLVLIWIADSGAYFAGRRFGKRKLAPVVSPGKTREGMYGALLGGLLWSAVLVWWYDGSPLQSLGMPVLCLSAVLASIVGDLFESLLKRQRGVKDSGALLPGHGGILDRIDSLTAAAPVFAFGLAWLDRMS
jgi:phosphatidate cytidylyltransferase